MSAKKENKKAIEAKTKGNEFYQKGNYQEAIKHYSKAIQCDPKDATFYSNRSAAYLKLNQFQKAMDDALLTIKYNPTWPRGYLRKASVFEAQEKFREAQETLHEGLKHDPQNQELSKKLEEINGEIRKIENRSKPPKMTGPKTTDENGNPLSPALKAKEEGNFHYKESRYDKAIEFYTKALDLTHDPKEKATFYANRAACNAQLQMYTDVIVDCSNCLEIEPDNVKALLRRGLAYESKENYKLSRQDMQAALSLDPNAKMASEALVRLDRAIRMQAKFK